MHPRGPSPGVVVTLPLSQENQSTNGTPRRQHPRNQPAAHKCGGSPAPLSSLQQGALLKYTYKTHWLTLEKQALNGEETVPRCTPGATCPGVWSPCGSPALIPCSRCRALGQPVLFLGTMGRGVRILRTSGPGSCQGPPYLKVPRLGWLHTSKQGSSMSPPVC